MKEQFAVNFVVVISGAGEAPRHALEDYIAHKLSISLMLQELKVDIVKIGSKEISLKRIRQRDMRI